MQYSQKYSLVQFFQQIDEGESFSMYEWHLHTTLADVFAVNRTDALMADLQEFADSQPYAASYIEGETVLGETPVWLIHPTQELRDIHLAVVDILEKHGAIFNTPAFTRDGYIPHITKQVDGIMNDGDKVIVNTFSLVDMFPEGDWQVRKVIRNFYPNV